MLAKLHSVVRYWSTLFMSCG